MKLVNVLYTGFGGVSGVVNGLVTAPGSDAHEWAMGYYGVAPLDQSHAAFCTKHGFRYEAFHPRPRRPLLAWLRLARWIISESPDAIICHSTTATPACAWASWLSGAPLIAVEHTSNEIKSFSEWLGSRAAMMTARRVVVLTEAYKELLAMRLGRSFRPDKVRRIPNGVDTTLFQMARDRICGLERLRAGMASRLVPTKRHDLLIDIAKEINLTLDFAGDGECENALKARASKGGGANVNFRGVVPAIEMPQWMCALDFYLHASDGETFSMSVLQAMASGLPVIASDISGMEELLGRNGHCGLRVPNTFEAWREAVQRLSADPKLRARMGRAARNRVEAYFSNENMLKNYLVVINEVVEKKSGK